MYSLAIIIFILFALLSIAPGILNRETLNQIRKDTGKTIPVFVRRDK